MENTNEGCVQPWEEQDKAPPGTLLTYVKPLHPSSLPFLLTSLHLNSSSPTCAALIPSEFWSWQMVPPAGTEVQFIENPPSHIYLLWFSIFYTPFFLSFPLSSWFVSKCKSLRTKTSLTGTFWFFQLWIFWILEHFLYVSFLLFFSGWTWGYRTFHDLSHRKYTSLQRW